MAKKKELTVKEKLEKVSSLLYDIKTDLEENDTDDRTTEMCVEASILIDEVYDEVGK